MNKSYAAAVAAPAQSADSPATKSPKFLNQMTASSIGWMNTAIVTAAAIASNNLIRLEK